MFFFSLFWAFFHSSLAPATGIGGVWPPVAITTMNTWTIPLSNTFLLITSGVTLTWSHHALFARSKEQCVKASVITLVLALFFTQLQVFEYINASFNMSDGIYGSCFYMLTGSHGLHVFVGTLALFVGFFRLSINHYTNEHHFGLEAAIWYWHFVDCAGVKHVIYRQL